MRGKNVDPGSFLLVGGRWHQSIPLGREFLGLSWLWGFPGSGKWLLEGTGDLAGQEHNQLLMSGFMTHPDANKIGRENLLPKNI